MSLPAACPVCDGSNACDGDRIVNFSAEGQTSSSNADPEVSELDSCSDTRWALSVSWRHKDWAVRALQSAGDTCSLRLGVMLFRLRP